MAVAYTFVQAMLKAGRNPTRADLVSAIQGGLPQGPVVAPYAYSSSDHAGITGAYMAVIKNGVMVQQGPVLVTDTSASGAITTYHGNRTAGAGEWHPLTVTPHRPSRLNEAGISRMTAETSRMAGGRARPPSGAVRTASPTSGRPAIRLLTAAEELFGERSYHRTTVADICARAGMATGSFYSYFGSKAEIFAAVVRAINTDLRRAMKAALEHTDGGQRASERASFRAYFDMLSQRPWIDRIVRESEFIDPGLFREYYEHLARGYARGVRAAQMAREVDARYDPEVIAFAYTGIGNFVGMRWADWTAGGRVPEDVLDDVLELLARGLAPRDPPGTPHRPSKPTGVDNPVEGVLTMLCGPGETPLRGRVDSSAERRGRQVGRVGRVQSSGREPRAVSSRSCMAHHGEMGCRPVRTASQNSSQSTHLASATSAGSGSGGLCPIMSAVYAA